MTKNEKIETILAALPFLIEEKLREHSAERLDGLLRAAEQATGATRVRDPIGLSPRAANPDEIEAENRTLLAGYPSLTLADIDRLPPAQRTQMLTRIAERGTNTAPPEPRLIGGVDRANDSPAPEMTQGDPHRPPEPAPSGSRPLELGHRVGESGSLSARNPDFEESGADDFDTRRTLVLGPGDIIELAHVGGDRARWSEFVASGKIVLDPDLPNPGRE